MRTTIGVDPGMTGGLVALTERGEVAAHLLMPIVGKGARTRVDAREIMRWLWDLDPFASNKVLWAIERIGAMPTDGARQAFTFGKSTGAIFAIAEVLGHEIVEISPKDWQRVWLRGYPKGDRKQIKASAALVASDRYPPLSADLRVKARWGLADAVLIAATAQAADPKCAALDILSRSADHSG